MSPQSARTIVLVSAGLMFAMIGIKRDTITDPFRFAWAAGVIILGLAVAADVAPEVAGPAAILILMAVYWRNRGVLGSVFPSSSLPAHGASASSTTQHPIGGPA